MTVGDEIVWGWFFHVAHSLPHAAIAHPTTNNSHRCIVHYVGHSMGNPRISLRYFVSLARSSTLAVHRIVCRARESTCFHCSTCSRCSIVRLPPVMIRFGRKFSSNFEGQLCGTTSSFDTVFDGTPSSLLAASSHRLNEPMSLTIRSYKTLLIEGIFS